jgi:hypothetical protein
MDKYYYLCAFSLDKETTFYQEIENGIVVRLVDLNGDDLNPPENFSYEIIDPEIKINLFNTPTTQPEENV